MLKKKFIPMTIILILATFIISYTKINGVKATALSTTFSVLYLVAIVSLILYTYGNNNEFMTLTEALRLITVEREIPYTKDYLKSY